MNNIYIPPGCYSLDKDTAIQQVRLGIQGLPNTGKTWAALTFPNPIVMNLNRGLKAHQGRSDVIEIPFYKPEFGGQRHEVKERIIDWLDREISKFTVEQTLVVDGLSDLEQVYHTWYAMNESKVATSSSGKLDSFIQWNLKEKFFNEITSNFKYNTKCNIVLICHEQDQPDRITTVGQPAGYSGKIRPLMTGKVKDSIDKDYTDWFRAHVSAKPTDYKSISPESLVNWGMKTTDEFKAMCDTFQGPTIYYWQTVGDDLFNAKSGSLIGQPKFIPANYTSFCKYLRKPQTTKQ